MPETLIEIGGLDLRSSAISASKGTLSNCLNFEKDQGAGVVRRPGWAPYDGRIMGPEIEDGVICQYNNVNLTGAFIYGEQVEISSAGLPTLKAIYIGSSVTFGGYPPTLCLAYPIQAFSEWYDITLYPAATQVRGISSLALVTTLTTAPTLMNASTISVPQYDNLKQNITRSHYLSVLAVPGRNEAPVDCSFTYGNNSYSIHDCVTFNFDRGTDGGVKLYPLEGHVLIDPGTGLTVGTVLNIQTTTGDWGAATAAGQFVIYDHPISQALPPNNTALDLYSADGMALLVVGAVTYRTTAPNLNNTRALLYSTYEQYVKDYSFRGPFGLQFVSPPAWQVPTPPTWTRPRLTREIPYKQGTGLGFGPVGSQDYSVYEYSRLGLTTDINQLSPISTGEKPPTVATDYTTGRWRNPNNIKVQDAAVTDYFPALGAGNIQYKTGFMGGSGFDFSSIPDNSVIIGIVFRVRAASQLVNGNWKDDEVRLTSSTFPNGFGQQNKATGNAPPNVLTDYTYGSATDTWGEQLTTAVIKDPSFGVVTKWKNNTNVNPNSTIQLDFYAMTVYYVPPTRLVYIRDPTIVAAPAQDVLANIIHYCIDSGTFTVKDAVGVLTASIGALEYQGTAAGKSRRLKVGDEIRTAASTAGTNAANGTLLGLVAAEDYPTSFPPSAALDANISRYEVIDANFWDVPEGRAAYIANGCEYATMWDGTFTVRIRTGRPTLNDNPRHLAAHLGYLHLGFKSGSVVNTGTGKPLSVLGAIGAAVYNFGEPITGMLTLNGQTLGVWTDRATRGLQGNSPTTAGGGSGYTPMMISPAINCIEYTLVNLVGEAVWASYRGIETVRTVNAYGDFETLPLSAAAQLWLQGRLQVDLQIGSSPSRAVGAVGIRNKRQYCLFFADGYFVKLTMFDAGDLPWVTIHRYARPNATTVYAGANSFPTNAGVIRHVYNGTRTDGKEIILGCFENQNVTVVPAAGGTNLGPYFPYVARLDCGLLDGRAPYMPCFLEFNAIYTAFPSVDQTFNEATIYMNAYGGSQLTLMTKFNWDGPIFDFTPVKDILQPDDPLVRQATYVLPFNPLEEIKAYIPVPQRFLRTDPIGEGRMLKLLIDGTQKPASLNPSITPVRITHISLDTSEALTTDGT